MFFRIDVEKTMFFESNCLFCLRILGILLITMVMAMASWQISREKGKGVCNTLDNMDYFKFCEYPTLITKQVASTHSSWLPHRNEQMLDSPEMFRSEGAGEVQCSARPAEG